MASVADKDPFYLRTGHQGMHGHEFLEFEYSQGRLRYANNSNYRNDSLIRKEMFVGPLVVEEFKRIIRDSEVTKEDDSAWPKKNIVGKQELEVRIDNEHISFETAKIGSLADVQDSQDPDGLRVFYYLVQDLKCFIFSLISLHFKIKPRVGKDEFITPSSRQAQGTLEQKLKPFDKFTILIHREVCLKDSDTPNYRLGSPLFPEDFTMSTNRSTATTPPRTVDNDPDRTPRAPRSLPSTASLAESSSTSSVPYNSPAEQPIRIDPISTYSTYNSPAEQPIRIDGISTSPSSPPFRHVLLSRSQFSQQVAALSRDQSDLLARSRAWASNSGWNESETKIEWTTLLRSILERHRSHVLSGLLSDDLVNRTLAGELDIQSIQRLSKISTSPLFAGPGINLREYIESPRIVNPSQRKCYTSSPTETLQYMIKTKLPPKGSNLQGNTGSAAAPVTSRDTSRIGDEEIDGDEPADEEIDGDEPADEYLAAASIHTDPDIIWLFRAYSGVGRALMAMVGVTKPARADSLRQILTCLRTAHMIDGTIFAISMYAAAFRIFQYTATDEVSAWVYSKDVGILKEYGAVEDGEGLKMTYGEAIDAFGATRSPAMFTIDQRKKATFSLLLQFLLTVSQAATRLLCKHDRLKFTGAGVPEKLQWEEPVMQFESRNIQFERVRITGLTLDKIAPTVIDVRTKAETGRTISKLKVRNAHQNELAVSSRDHSYAIEDDVEDDDMLGGDQEPEDTFLVKVSRWQHSSDAPEEPDISPLDPLPDIEMQSEDESAKESP